MIPVQGWARAEAGDHERALVDDLRDAGVALRVGGHIVLTGDRDAVTRVLDEWLHELVHLESSDPARFGEVPR